MFDKLIEKIDTLDEDRKRTETMIINTLPDLQDQISNCASIIARVETQRNKSGATSSSASLQFPNKNPKTTFVEAMIRTSHRSIVFYIISTRQH